LLVLQLRTNYVQIMETVLGFPFGFNQETTAQTNRLGPAQRSPASGRKGVQIADEQEACRRRSSEADRQTGKRRAGRLYGSSSRAPRRRYEEAAKFFYAAYEAAELFALAEAFSIVAPVSKDPGDRAVARGEGCREGRQSPAQLLEKSQFMDRFCFPWRSFCFPWRFFSFPRASREASPGVRVASLGSTAPAARGAAVAAHALGAREGSVAGGLGVADFGILAPKPLTNLNRRQNCRWRSVVR
jgi:hypothetical protein